VGKDTIAEKRASTGTPNTKNTRRYKAAREYHIAIILRKRVKTREQKRVKKERMKSNLMGNPSVSLKRGKGGGYGDRLAPQAGFEVNPPKCGGKNGAKENQITREGKRKGPIQ